MRHGAVYCLYDDHEYLELSLFPISLYMDRVLFLISDVPWNGSSTNNSETLDRVRVLCKENPKFSYEIGHWTNEIDQRNHGLSIFYRDNIDVYWVIDTDEVYSETDFLNIKKFIEDTPQIDAYHLEWNTYWKKSYHRIEPRENYNPVIAVRPKHFQFTIIRGGVTSVIRSNASVIRTSTGVGTYNGVLIPPQVGICHHLSYARTDDYIRRKLETNSHSSEFIPNWYDKVWSRWAPNSRNLHPVTPQQYAQAVPHDFAHLPNQLKAFIKKERLAQRPCSIILVNWNSADLLARCLDLIGKNTYRTYELIIVDNGSKNGSKEIIQKIACKKVFNETNLGFPNAVNQGLQLSGENDVCLLNVDAEVQPGWLDELVNTVINIPDCGVAGPLGNQIENGYQAVGSVTVDTSVPNVHGFCMFILREVLNKIGGLDPRFSPGGVEDVDYCMRARVAGYSVVISAKSLVIHKAHQVYDLNSISAEQRGQTDADHWGMYYQKYYGILIDYAKFFDYFRHDALSKTSGLVI